MADIDAQVGKTLAPIQHSARLLTTLPGVSDVTAQVLVAEIGVDMARFPTAAHLVSWTGLCPRNDESAGKRRSTRLRAGAPWLKTALVTAAWGAVRMKDTYLQAQFHRIRARRGAKKAIVAVAASILTAAYHAQERRGLPGPGCRSLHSSRSKQGHRASGTQTQRSGLRSSNHTGGSINRKIRIAS
jgi:transposase